MSLITERLGGQKICWRSRMLWGTLAAFPVQQGSAGLGAHAWRNSELQRKQPSVSSWAGDEVTLSQSPHNVLRKS